MFGPIQNHIVARLKRQAPANWSGDHCTTTSFEASFKDDDVPVVFPRQSQRTRLRNFNHHAPDRERQHRGSRFAEALQGQLIHAFANLDFLTNRPRIEGEQAPDCVQLTPMDP